MQVTTYTNIMAKMNQFIILIFFCEVYVYFLDSLYGMAKVTGINHCKNNRS